MDFAGRGVAVIEKLQEFVARAPEEMIDDAGDCRVSHVGKLDGRFIVVRFGFQLPLQKSFQVKAMQYRHHRGVGELPCGMDGNLDIFNSDGMPPPDGFHDVQFQRR